MAAKLASKSQTPESRSLSKRAILFSTRSRNRGVPDFSTGANLLLTGAARIVWPAEGQGAQRMAELEVEETVELRPAS